MLVSGPATASLLGLSQGHPRTLFLLSHSVGRFAFVLWVIVLLLHPIALLLQDTDR